MEKEEGQMASDKEGSLGNCLMSLRRGVSHLKQALPRTEMIDASSHPSPLLYWAAQLPKQRYLIVSSHPK